MEGRSCSTAIEHGLDIISGLHTFLTDDPDLVAAATAAGVTLQDVRRPIGPPNHREGASPRTRASG